MNTQNHPVFNRLTTPRDAFARHTVLHELEQRLAAKPRERSLCTKVQSVVERGVPYYAPGDTHYRNWARQVVDLWDQTTISG
jgi:hypothetical protein